MLTAAARHPTVGVDQTCARSLCLLPRDRRNRRNARP